MGTKFKHIMQTRVQKTRDLEKLKKEISGNHIGLSPCPVRTPSTATLAEGAVRVSRVLNV